MAEIPEIPDKYRLTVVEKEVNALDRVIDQHYEALGGRIADLETLFAGNHGSIPDYSDVLKRVEGRARGTQEEMMLRELTPIVLGSCMTPRGT